MAATNGLSLVMFLNSSVAILPQVWREGGREREREKYSYTLTQQGNVRYCKVLNNGEQCRGKVSDVE